MPGRLPSGEFERSTFKLLSLNALLLDPGALSEPARYRIIQLRIAVQKLANRSGRGTASILLVRHSQLNNQLKSDFLAREEIWGTHPSSFRGVLDVQIQAEDEVCSS